MLEIKYELKPQRKKEQFVSDKSLGFGLLRTDHMFLMDYSDGKWHSARIIPYQELNLFPGAVSLHYGQNIFEGLKAFKHKDREIYTFRIDKHAERFNNSAEALCMPKISIEDQIQAIHSLVDIDRNLFPEVKDASFYIRPFMFGTQDCLGVKPSNTYTYCVIISPSGSYYPQGFHPIKLLITKQFHRAAPGGIGNAKTGGNYAASLRAAVKAASFSAKQVLYTDVNNKTIEEAGAMNHFHVTKDREIIIPKFTDTILKSVTSTSIIELASRLGCKVKQETIYLDEFIKGINNGFVTEAGGLGTAAVVSPVGTYVFDDGKELIVGNGEAGPITRKMYNLFTAIQIGEEKAPEGWLKKVQRKL